MVTTPKQDALEILTARSILERRGEQIKNEDIVYWMENHYYVEATPEQDAGLIKLAPHQKAVLRFLFRKEGNKFPYDVILYSSIKKSGKALSIHTPIATPNGWAFMRELEDGDKVFDEQGNICNVTFATEVMYGHPCYKVIFTDGVELIADAEHLWQVDDLLDTEQYKAKIITTKEMLDSGLTRKDGARRYRIPINNPLKCQDILLPIDPYVLGIWLGDGNCRDARICTTDHEVLVHIAETEWVRRDKEYEGKAPMYSIGTNGKGGSEKKKQASLNGRLRLLGLRDNKHIPMLYLRASYEQRLSLLQGLMDSDGFISKARGTSGCECEISSNIDQLADGIMELVRSLGLKPTMVINESKYYGRITGYRHRIKFHATSDMPVFRLKRKLERQREATGRVLRSTNRHIKEIVPVDSVPVKCIQVDSPSSLYLAGEGMIPTHNTCIGGAVGRWAAETWGKRNDIYFVGNDANQAKEKGYQALRTSIELNDAYLPGKQVLPGEWLLRDTQAKCLSTNSIAHAVATDYKGEAGSNPVITIWTELWGFVDKAALRFWAEMAPSPTRPISIRFIETYAGFVGESELLEGLYNNVVQEGRQVTVRELREILGDKYEEGCFEEAVNEDDVIPIYVNEASRVCAYWDSGEKARRMPWQKGDHGQRYYASESASQTESQFRRLHLNEWVSAESEFIPVELWDACYNPLPLKPGEKTSIVVGLDAAVSGDCFGMVVVSRDPENPAGVALRTSRVWKPPEGGKIDFDLPGEALTRLAESFNIIQVCYDPYQLEYFAKVYRDSLGLWFEDFHQGQRRLEADKGLFDLIVHRNIRHDGDPTMREHIQNCNAKIPKDADDKLRLVKKSESRKIDLAVALSMAAAECLRLNI